MNTFIRNHATHRPIRTCTATVALVACALTTPVAQAFDVIDNGVFGDGRMRVSVGPLGDTNTIEIDPDGPLGFADVLQELTFYYDRGADGAASPLNTSSVGGTTIEAGTNCVTAVGTFFGPNGEIDWESRGCVPFGISRYDVTITFSSALPFGRMRFISYVSCAILANGNNDAIGVFGTPGTPGFRILNIDKAQSSGFTHGIGTLDNVTFAGWAAAEAPTLAGRLLAASPVAFSMAGNIDTSQIPQYNDPRYPGVRMHASPTSTGRPGYAFAFDPSLLATNATISFHIYNKITEGDVIFRNGFE